VGVVNKSELGSLKKKENRRIKPPLSSENAPPELMGRMKKRKNGRRV